MAYGFFLTNKKLQINFHFIFFPWFVKTAMAEIIAKKEDPTGNKYYVHFVGCWSSVFLFDGAIGLLDCDLTLCFSVCS